MVDMQDAEVEFMSSTNHDEIAWSDSSVVPKLDPHGFPLHPQPSDDPLDPLNWNRWFKLWVLLQVSFLAFLGPFSVAFIVSTVNFTMQTRFDPFTESRFRTASQVTARQRGESFVSGYSSDSLCWSVAADMVAHRQCIRPPTHFHLCLRYWNRRSCRFRCGVYLGWHARGTCFRGYRDISRHGHWSSRCR